MEPASPRRLPVDVGQEWQDRPRGRVPAFVSDRWYGAACLAELPVDRSFRLIICGDTIDFLRSGAGDVTASIGAAWPADAVLRQRKSDIDPSTLGCIACAG